MSEQVKYFNDDGTERLEILGPLEDEATGEMTVSALGPWPAVAMVLGSMFIVAGLILGLAWILIG